MMTGHAPPPGGPERPPEPTDPAFREETPTVSRGAAHPPADSDPHLHSTQSALERYTRRFRGNQ